MKTAFIICATFIVTCALWCIVMRSYGGYCYNKGQEAGIQQGYRLRVAEEALKKRNIDKDLSI